MLYAGMQYAERAGGGPVLGSLNLIFFSSSMTPEVAAPHIAPGRVIAGKYLIRYAQETAWREDHRRVANGTQVKAMATLAMAAPTSVDWCGYWQRTTVTA